jgi:hypothetical protein
MFAHSIKSLPIAMDKRETTLPQATATQLSALEAKIDKLVNEVSQLKDLLLTTTAVQTKGRIMKSAHP